MRICILSRDNIPIGYMDNDVPEALHFYDDTIHTYLEGTAHTFEFTASSQHEDSELLTVGNKLAFYHDRRAHYLTIMKTLQTETEIDVEAYSTSLELLNEQAIAYTASKAMSFEEYIKAFLFERRMLTIGVNEVSDKRIKHEWTGESDTVLKRLFSLANVFDAEIEFIPILNADYSLETIQMDIRRKHSDKYQGIGQNREDTCFRYGINISGITKEEDISELYTCIRATGKDDLTLAGLGEVKEFDDSGNVEYIHYKGGGEIYAPQARDRFPSNIVENGDKYICYQWKTDYSTVNALYSNALAKLKEISTPNVKYEIKGYIDVSIGDTVKIVDESFNPPLYLRTRVTEQEISVTKPEKNSTTFDNTTVLESQIDASLLKRLESFEKESKVTKAAAEEAKRTATTAQETASTAQSTADNAHALAQTAKDTADTASETATTASDKADAAQTTASTANATATEAKTTADTAQETANTASATATEAKATAEAAQTAITATQNYFFHDAEGAHVTTTKSDASTGKNVLIDSDSVDIRDGNSVLATFASDVIELGKEDLSAVIKMCQGKFSLSYDATQNTMRILPKENFNASGAHEGTDPLNMYFGTYTSGSGDASYGLSLKSDGNHYVEGNLEIEGDLVVTKRGGTGAEATLNGKKILTEDYKPAFVETINATGIGYQFIWVTPKEGYELVSVKVVQDDLAHSCIAIAYTEKNNLYTLKFSENIASTKTIKLRLTWVRV